MEASKLSTWKRGFLEIIAEILDCVMSRPLKKTHITFKCNLDSRAVTKYLMIMQSVGIVIKSKEDSSYYVITQKGIKYLHHFNSFVLMMEDDLIIASLKNENAKKVIMNLKIKSQG